MDTTFHFASAQELSPSVLEAIRQAYKEKPISIYIQEDNPVIPDWQVEEVRRRELAMGKNSLLDFDTAVDELEMELVI